VIQGFAGRGIKKPWGGGDLILGGNKKKSPKTPQQQKKIKRGEKEEYRVKITHNPQQYGGKNFLKRRMNSGVVCAKPQSGSPKKKKNPKRNVGIGPQPNWATSSSVAKRRWKNKPKKKNVVGKKTQ